ncbi:unnamed protein product (mitochondrion) [Plasmodiophora brassicae]|uniref:aldehyde dehydrogenase (NAD(+)) n=1 Tax=Plasmodiophora brassicae TaxID=37360 RepID=A0A3P3Y7K9_PLABS|nr:unnamed protein product [Plasmodiophora brassicae]
MAVARLLAQLGLSATEANAGVYDGEWGGSGDLFTSVNPATGEVIGQTRGATIAEYHETIARMDRAKNQWALTPAPVRGEVIRRIGDALRAKREALGKLISVEMGKILAEGIGEVQEAIDICDFACGLSRMLNGSVMPSERPGHFMMERWLPLNGHVAIISAFNFPVAVFFWNAALALVTGNTQVWKPADTVTLCAVACTRIIAGVLEQMKYPGAIASLVCGSGPTVGNEMVNDPRNHLVSFTGSTKVGRMVGTAVANRFGKSILELGGNNAMIVMPDADLDLALDAALFSAVGTAGQRCTTLRRLFLHESIFDSFLERLVKAYQKAAVQSYVDGIDAIKKSGGKILIGGARKTGNFVTPTIATINHDAECVQHEVFAPILYAFSFKTLEEAVQMHNAVPQGLSSSLFTRNLRNMLLWSGPTGSDCGIINVNVGTSGAEIGGAFGGEKETGGGRESGSDAWKAYCRRATCTVNHSDAMPLAQGIVFTADK